MSLFSLYDGLSPADQCLHIAHVMLCAFAVLIAVLPLLTVKGSAAHKIGGRIYVPVALAAMGAASFIAWREQSFVLFGFSGFCAYLLLSGWRAVRHDQAPTLIDWALPAGLLMVAVAIAIEALELNAAPRSFYLLAFALNAFYLGSRDVRALWQKKLWAKHALFLGTLSSRPAAGNWLGRHIAGMVGSVLANLSVVVLSVLPVALHWLWPVTLVVLGCAIAWKEHMKKRPVRQAMRVLSGKSSAPARHPGDRDDFRRAA